MGCFQCQYSLSNKQLQVNYKDIAKKIIYFDDQNINNCAFTEHSQLCQNHWSGYGYGDNEDSRYPVASESCIIALVDH